VSLPRDLERMAEFITAHAIKLVVVDPLMAYLGGDVDAHKDQDVRRVLRPLSKLAGKLDVVVLLVRHLNKLSGGPALYRGGSSIGITGAARASLIVGRDPNQDRHVLAMNKLNLGPKPRSLAYRLEGADMACRIVWEPEPCDLHPDQILGHGPARTVGRPPDARTVAMTFLRDLLADGPVTTALMIRLAAEAGIADATLKRARADLGVEPYRDGGVYYVRLPGHGSTTNIDPPPDDDEETG
jgi:putative DNA primase/helicase